MNVATHMASRVNCRCCDSVSDRRPAALRPVTRSPGGQPEPQEYSGPDYSSMRASLLLVTSPRSAGSVLMTPADEGV